MEEPREELAPEATDPELALKERLRMNLAMTPAERYERHQRLARQLRILMEARNRHLSGVESLRRESGGQA